MSTTIFKDITFLAKFLIIIDLDRPHGTDRVGAKNRDLECFEHLILGTRVLGMEISKC